MVFPSGEKDGKHGADRTAPWIAQVGRRPLPTNYVAPRWHGFSQSTISQNLSSNGTVNELVEGLRSGKISPEDIPTIRVVELDGQLVTLDNRRLAAFQAAGVEEIPIEVMSLSDPAVRKEFLRKYNPIDEGEFVVVTPNAAGKGAAEEVLREHEKIR